MKLFCVETFKKHFKEITFKQRLFFEKVVNLEYGNFENLTSKKCLKSGELSSPLSAYSYC